MIVDQEKAIADLNKQIEQMSKNSGIFSVKYEKSHETLGDMKSSFDTNNSRNGTADK